jgi:Ca2+-binding EF-hand superfamily protein
MPDRLFVRSQARIAALALLLPAAAAFAQATEVDHLKNLLDHAKERFTAADTDHDGMLTKAEAQKGMPFVAKHFDEIDTAKAGKVSVADITKFMEERRAKVAAAAKAGTNPDK